MAKRYRVTPTDEERDRLESLTHNGAASERMVRRAPTLLLAAEEERDNDIAKALRIGVSTVKRTRSPVRQMKGSRHRSGSGYARVRSRS